MYQPRDRDVRWESRRDGEGGERRNFVPRNTAQRDTWVNPRHALPSRPDSGPSTSKRSRGTEGYPPVGDTSISSHSPEPGQITSPRPGSPSRSNAGGEFLHRRDDGRNGRPGSRSRGASPVREQVGSVTEALETFSRTMHSVLLLTSQEALARTHLNRIQSFPSSSDSPILREAQDKLYQTERDLNDSMITLQDGFSEVIRRTVRVTGKGEPVDIGALELSGLKDRLRRLERSTASALPSPSAPAPPPPPPPSSPPLPTDREVRASDPKEKGKDTPATATEDREDKRRRAQAILKDVVARLEAVEEMKDNWEVRCSELESLIWERNDEVFEPSLTWGKHTSVRSAPKVVRAGDKRKRDAPGLENEEDGWERLEGERDPDMRLRSGSETAYEPNPAAEAATVEIEEIGPIRELEDLKDEVQELKEEIKEMKAKREAREKELIKAALDSMKETIAIETRKELKRLSQSLKPGPRPPSTASNSRASPANGHASLSPELDNSQYPDVNPYANVSGSSTSHPGQNSRPAPRTPAEEMIQAASDAIVSAAARRTSNAAPERVAAYTPQLVPQPPRPAHQQLMEYPSQPMTHPMDGPPYDSHQHQPHPQQMHVNSPVPTQAHHPNGFTQYISHGHPPMMVPNGGGVQYQQIPQGFTSYAPRPGPGMVMHHWNPNAPK